MTRRTALFLVVLGALVGGCRKPAAVPNPASFDRPGAIAFGCYDTRTTVDPDTGEIILGPHFLPQTDCTPAADGTLPSGLHLVSFVAQQATGELAAVDLTDRRVMDASRLIPGFTFPKVGELPSGVAVPPDDTSIVFVSNLGSRTVQSVSSSDFSYLADPRFRKAGAGSTVALEDGPTDLAYFPTTNGQGLLFAPLPYVGKIAVIRVDAEGVLTYDRNDPAYSLTLASTVPPATPRTPAPEFERLCPVTTDSSDPTNPAVVARTATIAPRTPVTLGTTPEPVRVRVVEGPTGPELLVADQSLPLIHRFDLDATANMGKGGGTALTPLSVSVPVLDLVVTPKVPATAGANVAATERYIYAIDAVDESVLVVDYTGTATSTSPDFGAVLPVAVGDAVPDRVPLPFPARVLTVVEPQYDLDENDLPVDACAPDGSSGTPSEAMPTRMRGVFVAVATSEGTLRFIDVYDLDAACRGGQNCQNPPVSGDERVIIRRHHARIGGLLTRAPATTATPTMTFLSQTGVIGTNGLVSGSDSLGLEPFASCPGNAAAETSMFRLYPDLSVTEQGTQPILCALDDAHQIVGQPWSITYEGAIPGAFGARGRLVASTVPAGVVLEDSFATFCDRGVLGTTDIAASGLDPNLDPEAGYGGDMMVITSELPWSHESDPACAAFATRSDGTIPFLAFRIVSAFETQLVLGSQVRGDDDVPASLAQILACFTDPISYQVRTLSAFTVATISNTYKPPFRHRVIASTGGACRVDVAGHPVDPQNPDSYRNGRAIPGRPYIHPQIAFQIRPLPSADRHNVTGKLAVTVGAVPAFLRYDVGLLPESIAFNPYDGGLYVVDVANNQMVQLGLTPLTRTAILR